MTPTTAAGVYLSTADFEAIVHGLSTALTTLAGDRVRQSLHAPPVIARSVIERTRYHESFPQLLGRIYASAGAEPPTESDVVLLPAGCYCVYPAYEGVRLTGETEVSVEATCFRQEATAEIGRLRSFRMRELVRLGAAAGCRAWRDNHLALARDWLAELEVATETLVASDPFFGGGSRMLQALQTEQELKIELVAEVGPGQVQAVASGNYHKDQFGRLFAIVDPAGGVAHTACLAFGYERLALSLTHHHGVDPASWPDRVRKALGLGEPT